ncbi:hypothetical protein [Pontixanthobacter aquaemixtae]|nr:hypothetical protein [Pontixanthobacter aquaemixtae]
MITRTVKPARMAAKTCGCTARPPPANATVASEQRQAAGLTELC